MNLETSLRVRGFALAPWHRDPSFTDFRHRNYSGLFQLHSDAIHLVGVFAERPGSGTFGAFIDLLEDAADECEAAIVVSNFWNERLRQWFRRRGYTLDHMRELGQHAVRSPNISVN